MLNALRQYIKYLALAIVIALSMTTFSHAQTQISVHPDDCLMYRDVDCKVTLKWSSPVVGEICLVSSVVLKNRKSDGTERVLKCWDSVSSAEMIDTLSDEGSYQYSLVGQDRISLATVTIEYYVLKKRVGRRGRIKICKSKLFCGWSLRP